MPRDPYCGNCGYSLRELTESSRCPECGKPIVEVLERDRAVPRGKRYRSPIMAFGLPLVHIAFGPHEDEAYGRARGIIAVGDAARGWLAVGGRAFGIIAVGGVAVGGAVLGGGAVGAVANGGGAIGCVADGGGAVVYFARGGGVLARHAIDWHRRDPQAVGFFEQWSWLLGPHPMRGSARLLGGFDPTLALWLTAAGLLIAGGCALVLVAALGTQRRSG